MTPIKYQVFQCELLSDIYFQLFALINSMGGKRGRKSQMGQQNKTSGPKVKIRKAKSDKKMSSDSSVLFNDERANYSLIQWVSDFIH